MLGAIVLTGLAVAALAGMKKGSVSGVGAVKRAKRRIYKEISEVQSLQVDLSKKFDEMSAEDKKWLKFVGEEYGWKQTKRSIESGKSYEEAYYNSLRRAYNAVCGVQGVGMAWNVRNADGNIVLTWYEQSQILDHVSKEDGKDAEDARARVEQMEEELRKSRRKVSQFDHSLVTPNLQEDEPANENSAELPGDDVPTVRSYFAESAKFDIKDQTNFEYNAWRYNSELISLHDDGSVECIMYDPDLLILQPYLIGKTESGTIYRGLCGDDGYFNLSAVDPSEKKLYNAIKKVLVAAERAGDNFDTKAWDKVRKMLYSAPFNKYGKIELQQKQLELPF